MSPSHRLRIWVLLIMSLSVNTLILAIKKILQHLLFIFTRITILLIFRTQHQWWGSFMAIVKKKNRMTSAQDLIQALQRFIELLVNQHEDDAVADLRSASQMIQENQPSSEEFGAGIKKILDAFDGEHELQAYTLRREKEESQWTEAEELYLTSANVLNLARRLKSN